MSRRVVVTGMGAITPIGNSVEEFWNGLKEKKVGIAPITYFDTTDYKAKLAAEVKNFDPKQFMDPKAAKRMEQFCQFAVAATRQAVEDAGLDMSQEDPFRVGVSIGSGIGSLQSVEREYTSGKRTGPCKSASGSADDQQYGSRKCFHPVWHEGQMHQCSNRVCNRHPLHW